MSDSCFDDNPEIEPLWEMNLKDYDKDELATLVTYIDATSAWFDAKGISAVDSEDVVGFRVGMPIITGTDTLETTSLYLANNDLDQLVKSVSLDAFKISVKTTVDGVAYSQPYTFKSSFTHNIFTKYYVEGVENLSGFSYLNTTSFNLSANEGIAVEYGGTSARVKSALDIPDDVYGCMVYVIQNTTLYTVNTGTTVVKKGDVTYYSTKGFYDHLAVIKTKALEVIGQIATPQQEDLHELMVYLGVDQAFKDLQFGGGFDSMRIVMRIPTSRSNQLALEGLLGKGDVFDDIFKIKTFTHTDLDMEFMEKKEDLEDPYSTDKLTYTELDDSVSGYYGCKTGETYRYWYVNDEWLGSLTPEQLSAIFWIGLDVITELGNPCPYDEILAIVIVVVMTYLTAGIGSGTALTVSQGITVLSGILSIASITGVIDTKTAAMLGAVLAVASLGTSMLASGTTITNTFSQAISVASTVLETVNTFEAEKFKEVMEEKKDQLESLEADANMWESEFRFMYGESFEMGVRQGPEADPYAYLKDTYNDFTIYKSNGFM